MPVVKNALAIMTEYEFRKMFPKASASFASANPQLRVTNPTPETPPPQPKQRRGLLNATERNFALILEAQKRKGEIHSYEFEGITLRFSGVSYTPDFCVWPLPIAVSGQIKFIEIKGAYCKGKFERAVERFRHAKTYYGDRFLFELHQKTRDGFKRLL